MLSPGARPHGGTARIALAVGDEHARAILEKLVAAGGHRSVAATPDGGPEILISDWPAGQGTRRLLELERRPELIAIVADGDTAAAEAALDAGAGDCLMLPLRTAETSMRLAAALRRRDRAVLARPGELVDALPTGLAVLAPDGRISQVNRTLSELVGAAELVGLRIDEDGLLGPDPVRVLDLFRRARADGTAADGELTLRAPNRPEQRVTVRLATSRDDTGTVSAYLLTVRQLNAREREQDALVRIASAMASEPASGVFSRLAQEAALLVGATSAVVLRADPTGMTVVGAAGVSLAVGTRLDADARTAYDRALSRSGGHHLSVQLRAGGRDWGLLAVAVDGADPGGALHSLERFATVAGMAALDADTRQRLADPTRDPLTGLPGHRAFFERLDAAVASARAARRPLSLIVLDVDHLKRINDRHGHAVGDAVVHEIGRRVGASIDEGHLVARVGGEEFAWLLEGADVAAAMDAARRMRRNIAETPIANIGGVTVSFGVAQLGGGEPGADTPTDLHRQAEVALQWAKMSGRNRCAAYSFEVAEEVFSRRAAMPAEAPNLRAMRALAWAVDARDPHTHRHSARVADLAVRIATALGWTLERATQLREAGLVHDVGKIAVPDAILFKPDRLTDVEFAVVKEHAAVGARIVEDVLSAEQAAWVRAHHERWDGGGYPDGLAGERIPEEARVLAVADAWDVIVSPRTYKDACTIGQALIEIRRCSGAQFWPPAVAALERLVAAGAIAEDGAATLPPRTLEAALSE